MKKAILPIFILAFVLIGVFGSASNVSAINLNLQVDWSSIPGVGEGLNDLLGCESGKNCNGKVGIYDIVIFIYRTLLWFSVLVAFIAIIYTGFSYVVSGANPQLRAKARERTIKVFTGGAILLFAVVILNFLNEDLTQRSDTLPSASCAAYLAIDSNGAPILDLEGNEIVYKSGEEYLDSQGYILDDNGLRIPYIGENGMPTHLIYNSENIKCAHQQFTISDRNLSNYNAYGSFPVLNRTQTINRLYTIFKECIVKNRISYNDPCARLFGNVRQWYNEEFQTTYIAELAETTVAEITTDCGRNLKIKKKHYESKADNRKIINYDYEYVQNALVREAEINHFLHEQDGQYNYYSELLNNSIHPIEDNAETSCYIDGELWKSYTDADFYIDTHFKNLKDNDSGNILTNSFDPRHILDVSFEGKIEGQYFNFNGYGEFINRISNQEELSGALIMFCKHAIGSDDARVYRTSQDVLCGRRLSYELLQIDAIRSGVDSVRYVSHSSNDSAESACSAVCIYGSIKDNEGNIPDIIDLEEYQDNLKCPDNNGYYFGDQNGEDDKWLELKYDTGDNNILVNNLKKVLSPTSQQSGDNPILSKFIEVPSPILGFEIGEGLSDNETKDRRYCTSEYVHTVIKDWLFGIFGQDKEKHTCYCKDPN